MWRSYGKIIFKVLLLLLILVGALNYLLYLRGADPTAMWKNIAHNLMANIKVSTSNSLTSLDDFSHKLKSINSSTTQTQIYAWQDAEGTMHYSTSKPEGVEVKSRSYDPEANVIQRIKLPAANNATISKPNSHPSAVSAPSSNNQSLAKKAADLSAIDLEKLDKTLKARQQELDRF